MASTYLTRTAGTPTLNTKYTISFWVKRHKLTYSECFLFDAREDGSNRFKISFQSADKIECFNLNGGSNTFDFVTNRQFRDPASWYHIVLAVDTTLSSATDRVKLYINGTQETSFSSYNFNGSQSDTNNIFNENGRAITIGAYNGGSSYSNFAEISLSHVHFIDGTAYAPSTFGSTDATTGEWTINTAPSVTYGNNGFFILKDGASVTDQSGNSNNWAVGGGTLTPTEDCPDNVFPVMNPLAPGNSSLTFTNGNLHNGDQSPNDWQAIPATFAAFTGKFYWEFKIEGVWGSTSNTTHRHGVANMFATLNNNPGNGDVAWTDDPYAIGWQNSSGIRYNGDSGITMTSEFGTYVANDILMFAMDLTNKKLYFGKNGTWLNSGDPTSGSSGTGAYSMPDLGRGGMWAPYSETKYGSDKVSWNMGNGYFKTTAISSEGSNASGIGKFEYDVPTGYTALSTKGLNE